MKLTKQDLGLIHSIAKQNYVDNSSGELSDQEFITKCYIEAAAGFLKVDVEFPVRISVEPVE